MSFGGTVTRGRRGGGSSGPRSESARRPLPAGVAGAGARTSAQGEEGDIDWERVAVFGTGIVIGGMIGAGVALLFAPSSGEETRAAIARRGVRLAHRGRDVWDELREELEWAARRGKRRVGRRVQRARWAAEDFIDERRRPNRWWTKRSAERKEEPELPEVDDRAVEEIVESLG